MSEPRRKGEIHNNGVRSNRVFLVVQDRTAGYYTRAHYEQGKRFASPASQPRSSRVRIYATVAAISWWVLVRLSGLNPVAHVQDGRSDADWPTS